MTLEVLMARTRKKKKPLSKLLRLLKDQKSEIPASKSARRRRTQDELSKRNGERKET